jgi:CO dehydrogenase/acetyl-CoA synthase epsilon subunit
MNTREECLDHLIKFVLRGDIEQAAVAAGTIVAYLATLEGKPAQLAAIDRLQKDLTKGLKGAEVRGDAEDRHVDIEDALAKARATLEKA